MLRRVSLEGFSGEATVGRGLRVSKNIVGDPRDRPVGMRDAGFDYIFEPQVLALNYALADRASRTDFGRGRGVVEIRYRDAEQLKGDYTLYLQIERR